MSEYVVTENFAAALHLLLDVAQQATYLDHLTVRSIRRAFATAHHAASAQALLLHGSNHAGNSASLVQHRLLQGTGKTNSVWQMHAVMTIHRARPR